MKKIKNLLISSIAFIEIAIGIITLFALILSVIFALSRKSINVFIFVFVSALLSSLLGLGLILRKELARKLLIFFSGWVILSKALLFAGIMEFKGELLTFISSTAKNIISVAYHTAVVALLSGISFENRKNRNA